MSFPIRLTGCTALALYSLPDTAGYGEPIGVLQREGDPSFADLPTEVRKDRGEDDPTGLYLDLTADWRTDDTGALIGTYYYSDPHAVVRPGDWIVVVTPHPDWQAEGDDGRRVIVVGSYLPDVRLTEEEARVLAWDSVLAEDGGVQADVQDLQCVQVSP